MGIPLVYFWNNWRATEEQDISHYYIETYIFKKVNSGIEILLI